MPTPSPAQEQGWTAFQSDLVVGLIVATVALLGAVLLLVVQLRATRKLAREQGTLRKANLGAFLISSKLPKEVIVALRLDPQRPAFLSIPLAVANSGDCAARGITAFIKVPRAMVLMQGLQPSDSAMADIAGIKMAEHKEKDSTTYIFSWPVVTPAVPQVTQLPVHVSSPSRVVVEATGHAKDGVPVQVTAEAIFSFPISVLVADEDGQTVAFSHHFDFVDGGEDELRAYVERKTQLSTDRPTPVPASRWLRFKRNWLTPGESTLSRVHAFVLGKPRPTAMHTGVDLFSFEGSTLYDGLVDRGRYFVPSLATSFFGDEPDGALAEIYARRKTEADRSAS